MVSLINIKGVIANSLWIVGLAVILATLSWANGAALAEGLRFRKVWSRKAVRGAAYLGLTLFCVGLAATASTWWEQLLWSLLALSWSVQCIPGLFKPPTKQ